MTDIKQDPNEPRGEKNPDGPISDPEDPSTVQPDGELEQSVRTTDLDEDPGTVTRHTFPL